MFLLACADAEAEDVLCGESLEVYRHGGGGYFHVPLGVMALLALRLDGEVPLGSAGVWRNGSASDSRSEGWEFESLCPHFVCFESVEQTAY